MANADWVSYTIAVIYLTLLLGCLLGIRMNMVKETQLKLVNELHKQKRVIKWKYRFYITLFLATSFRIAGLIGAVVKHKKLLLANATTKDEFFWQIIASSGSLLYFSSFSFIIWFFAHLVYHQQLRIKKTITPILTTLNVALYISTITLAIASFAASKWDLLFDVEIPLFSISGWLLAIGFIMLSCKISSAVEEERKVTVDYIEHSRRASITGSRRVHNQPPEHHLIYGNNVNNSAPLIKDDVEEQQLSLNNSQQQQQDYNNQINTNKHIISRLVKLSLASAICWIIRGLYLMALRIDSSTDTSPFAMPDLSWEALFYFLTEYPPSLGALMLMIMKPKNIRGNGISIHEYPKVRDDYPN